MTVEGESDGSLGRTRRRAGWAVAIGGTAGLTAVLTSLRADRVATFEAMLYLALAVGCALVGGRWPAVCASVLGALALDYFFIEPLHALDVASRVDLLMLALFTVVSVGVASVVDSAARRRHQATVARQEAQTLAMLNRAILTAEYDVPQLLDLARQTFGARAAELVDPAQAPGPGDTAVSAGPDTLLVLRGAVLGPGEQRVLAAFATHLGVLRERAELARQTEAARELEAGNRVRTALIAAVSHDLRTPLAGIRAAAETLRRQHDRLPPADRADLLIAIEDSTARLTTIVTDLLDLSRLQTGGVTPVLDQADLNAVVSRVLADLGGPDRVTVAARLPVVVADTGLLERSVANLVANALRHTDDAVEIVPLAEPGAVGLAVVDHGPGVARELRGRMFEPFQRLGDTTAPGHSEGLGLGLAVARGLVEAQGGRLAAEETPGGGLTMRVELRGAA